MYKPEDFKPGDIVTIQRPANYMYEYRRTGLYGHYGEAKAVLRTPPPVKTTVLAATPDFLLCEGRTKQSEMHQSVQDACKEAGLDPAVTIQLGYYTEVEFALNLTQDVSPSMESLLKEFNFDLTLDFKKYIFDTKPDLSPKKFIFDTEDTKKE